MNIVMPEYETLTRGDIDMDGFHRLGTVKVLDGAQPEEFQAALADAEVLLVNKTETTAELLKDAKKLRYVGECATGYNNIDVNYCRQHGITVTNVPAYSTDAVAQHAFALILEHYSKVAAYNDLVQDGTWIASKSFSCFPYDTEELSGKVLGLVGYGRIGRRVAAIGNAFGMTVLATTRHHTSGGDSLVTFVPQSELLARADVVSCHCPLNAESDGLFDADAFARMRQGAFFVNTSRGPVVDEDALAFSLKSGHLGGAALDVLGQEPMEADCPLLGLPNCIITPHVAWAPRDTRQRLVDIAVENLRSFLAGQPKNVVGQ